MKIKIVLVSALIVASGFAWYLANWKPIPEQAEIKFTLQNRGQAVTGVLSGLQGDIHFDENNLAAAVFSISLDAASINTGIESRDSHLRKPDFFDAAAYPKIYFKSKTVQKKDAAYRVTGDLQIKNFTKEVSIDFTFHKESSPASFKGKFTIDRMDFKIGDEHPDMDRKVIIELNVPVKQN